jgi:hypothetical protein
VDGPDPWVHVRGCPWSSVVVDVPTDVDREALLSRALTGCVSGTEHLIPGQVFHDQALQRDSGIIDERRNDTDLARWDSCGIPSAWRSPTTRRPRGSPRRNRCVRHVALPLGCRVVALGGRREATPCPRRPSRSDSCAELSRRPARPARACFCCGPCCVCRVTPLREQPGLWWGDGRCLWGTLTLACVESRGGAAGAGNRS